MIAGLQQKKQKIKCPHCEKYKIPEHLESDNCGSCDFCGTVWATITTIKDKKIG